MRESPSAAHYLALYLLAAEAQGSPDERLSDGTLAANTAAAVFAKLRDYLIKLIGVGGFEATLSRALSLARKEVPWLESVRADADARLTGFDVVASSLRSEEVERGSQVVLTQLLGVLMMFVGEDLTARLLRDVWPDIPEELVEKRGRVGRADRSGYEAGREESGE